MERCGVYRYGVWHKAEYVQGRGFQPAYVTHHTVKVEVLEVLKKQYRVKFLGTHKDGRGPGTVTAVNQTSVTLDVEPPYTSPATGTIRLPYKDND